MVARDLEHVAECCKLLTARRSLHFLDKISEALLDSAIIRYGRCFNRGARTRLDSLLKHLPEADLECHRFFVDLRDMHLAHSVNEFEMAGSQIFVAEEEDVLVRGGLGIGGCKSVQPSLAEVEQFCSLAEALTRLVKNWSKKLDGIVQGQVDSMSDAEVRALPVGFPPTKPKFDVKARRTWPETNLG